MFSGFLNITGCLFIDLILVHLCLHTNYMENIPFYLYLLLDREKDNLVACSCWMGEPGLMEDVAYLEKNKMLLGFMCRFTDAFPI